MRLRVLNFVHFVFFVVLFFVSSTAAAQQRFDSGGQVAAVHSSEFDSGDVGFGEDLAGGGDAVERGGKPGIDGHLLEDVHDLLARGAGGERRAEVMLERRGLRAERGQQGDGGQFTRHGVERPLSADAAARADVPARNPLHLVDLGLLRADVERRLGVPLQLRRRVPERAQCRDRAQLARPHVESGTRQHLAEREVDGEPDEIGCDIRGRKDRRRGARTSQLLERRQADGVPVAAHVTR